MDGWMPKYKFADSLSKGHLFLLFSLEDAFFLVIHFKAAECIFIVSETKWRQLQQMDTKSTSFMFFYVLSNCLLQVLEWFFLFHASSHQLDPSLPLCSYFYTKQRQRTLLILRHFFSFFFFFLFSCPSLVSPVVFALNTCLLKNTVGWSCEAL